MLLYSSKIIAAVLPKLLITIIGVNEHFSRINSRSRIQPRFDGITFDPTSRRLTSPWKTLCRTLCSVASGGSWTEYFNYSTLCVNLICAHCRYVDSNVLNKDSSIEDSTHRLPHNLLLRLHYLHFFHRFFRAAIGSTLLNGCGRESRPQIG